MFLEFVSYSSISRTRARTLLFPPVGSANDFPHTRQSMGVLALPNMICSFLHFGHLILMNFELVSRSLSFM